MKQCRRRPAPNPRAGMAVIEIMVGIVLLAIGLLGVAGMTLAAARRATTLSVQQARDGVVLEELNRLSALPYDSIASRTGCATFSSSVIPHTRCITYSDVTGGSGYRRIQIIITPTDPSAKAETVYVNRSKGTPRNPLKP